MPKFFMRLLHIHCNTFLGGDFRSFQHGDILADMALELDGKQAVLTAFLQTFWGTFLVAFGIWFYRRRKEKAPEEAKKTDQVF